MDGGVDGEVDGAGCHQLFIQMGENMGKPETCSPQRLRRLLNPPSLRCHNQVKPETCLVRVALCFQDKVDPRIQLREDMIMVRPETCSPQRLRRLDPPAQPALLLHLQGM